MQKIRIAAMGRLTEAAFRDAAAEYVRRIGRFFDLTVTEIRPEPLPQNPSPAEIAKALDREADRILDALPARAVAAALCVEGRQMSSEDFARWIGRQASEGGEIVGTIMAGHDGRRGFLYHVAVSPDHQGQGIGRRLTEAAMEALSREGIFKTALVVFADNDGGNAFWESQGFTIREDLNYRNKALAEMIRIDPEYL